MKITVIDQPGNDSNEWHDKYNLVLESDHNKIEVNFHDGEPEDATLGRDFNDVYSIVDLIKEAHEAGSRGEPLSIEEVQEEDV